MTATIERTRRARIREQTQAGAQDATLPEQILDRLARPVLVIDAQRQLHYANAAARRLLQRNDIAHSREGRLLLADRELTSRLDAYTAPADIRVDKASAKAAAKSVVLRGRDEVATAAGKSHSYRILVTPLHVAAELQDWSERRWLLFVSETLSERTICLDVLKQFHGLTHMESLLVSHLFSGASLTAAAAALEITINTAKTHLKQVFLKCDVQSQAELLQLLALGPREF